LIDRADIVNFKCFRAAKIPLRSLTMLSGGNGVGKSSVVQSLLLLRQTNDQMRKVFNLLHGRAAPGTRLPVKLNDEYRLCLGNSATLTNAEIESDIVTLGVTGTTAGTKLQVSFSFEASTTKPTTSIQCVDGPEALDRLQMHEAALSIFHPKFHYLVAERVGPRDLQFVADQDFVSTGYAGEFTAYAISEAESYRVAEGVRLVAESDLFKVQLEAWMSRLIPGVQIFSRPFLDINRVQMSIGRRGAATPPLPPANTGFGISYSLPVVVSGLLAEPGSMFIVENPEAHLHPAAQTAIGFFLACVASTGVQVVVETHSENVLNGVRIAALEGAVKHDDALFLFLSLVEGSTEPAILPIEMDSAAELTSWPVGFFDQQGADLAGIMRARRAQRLAAI